MMYVKIVKIGNCYINSHPAFLSPAAHLAKGKNGSSCVFFYQGPVHKPLGWTAYILEHLSQKIAN